MTKTTPPQQWLIATLALLLGALLPTPGEAQVRYEYLRCDSQNYGYNFCPFRVGDGRVEFYRPISDTECRQNRNWGYKPDGIWVDNGCSAYFRVVLGDDSYPSTRPERPTTRPERPNGRPDRLLTVRCESYENRRERCPLPFSDARVRVQEQLSDTPCRRGSNWDTTDRYIQVYNGCRAVFSIERDAGRRDGDYGRRYDDDRGRRDGDRRPPPGQAEPRGQAEVVRCESNENREERCRLPFRNARVSLKEQLSDSPCQRGRNWDVTANALWVSQGCRAEFYVAP